MKPVYRFFERVLDIRAQELSRVALMSTYLLLIIASYTTAKAVRDSLFVTNIGPAQLPYVYLIIAAAMGLVSLVHSRLVNRIGLHRLIRMTAVIAITNLLLFLLLFTNNSAVWFYALYVWASLFGAITASQFWLLATHVFNPLEARRVFAWVGLGGIIGGIVGGGLTNRMASRLGTESLLIVCAVMMAATIVLLERICRRHYADFRKEEETEPQESTSGALFRQVRKSRYLSMMTLLLSVAVVAEAFIDYEYKVVARGTITSKDHLTAFFGSITFYIGVSSLVFQMLLTSRILKRWGVGSAITLLPAGLLGAFMIVVLRPTLWAAAVLQLVDGTFSYSIHRSGMELLYLPIPPQTRNTVKGFIDMFVDRTGRAVGAILLLVLTTGLAFSIPSLSIVAIGLVAVWIILVVAVKRGYMNSFRQALEKRAIDPEALHLHNLDIGTIKTLLRLLPSEDESQVLYALDLLSNTHPNLWRDHVNRLIHHPSPAVRARTIAVLARVNDPSIGREEFVHHPDYETARIACATAMRLQWTGSFRDRAVLTRLLHDSSAAVVREAMITCGVVGFQESLPLLVEKLSDKRLRRDARSALLTLGCPIIAALGQRLSDPDVDPAIRKRIPKTLALTGSQEAADVLLDHLHRWDYQLDCTVLKALNRMRANSPQIVLEPARVETIMDSERQRYERLHAIRDWFQANPVDDVRFPLLLRALSERLEQRLERMFRLIALIYSPHDVYSVYYSCIVKPPRRPAAIEFLSNILDAKLTQAVIPLLEEAFGLEEHGVAVRQPLQFISHTAALETLILENDAWLGTIAKELMINLDSTVIEKAHIS
jgi:ATP/ADP translocase/HEAT repeat protein